MFLNLSSVSLWAKRHSSAPSAWERALGSVDTIQGCYWNEGSPGQVSVSMAVVWFAELLCVCVFFFSCLVRLSPFDLLLLASMGGKERSDVTWSLLFLDANYTLWF